MSKLDEFFYKIERGRDARVPSSDRSDTLYDFFSF